MPKSILCANKLLDGRSVHVRPIRPDDKSLLTKLMRHLSYESLFFRFFIHKKQLTEDELVYFTELDLDHHVGLVAAVVKDDSERPVGVGRYIICSTTAATPTAELAFVVMEEYQGQGIATLLLAHLIQIARAEGIARFVAFVMCGNRKMLGVLRKTGLPMKEVLSSAGVIEISLSLKRRSR